MAKRPVAGDADSEFAGICIVTGRVGPSREGESSEKKKCSAAKALAPTTILRFHS